MFFYSVTFPPLSQKSLDQLFDNCISFSLLQSGASSLAKHGGAYFSVVYGSIQDPIAAPGPYENQEF